jgi:choline dehydrogenase
MQVTQRGGRRCSAAAAYLKPVLKRANLRVISGAHVTRITLEGTRATGVEFLQGGRLQRVAAAREVVLSGGAVNSPQLLMLSGIGPAAELRELDIEPRVDLPGVGRNLQDHPIIGPFFHVTRPISLVAAESPANLAKYLLRKRGMLTSNAAEALAFVRSEPGLPAPDLEIVFAPVPFQYEGLQKPDCHGMTIAASAIQPRSRGVIRLRSADALAPARIEPNYFSDPEGHDMKVMVDGFKLSRRIATQPAFVDLVGEEFDGSKDAQTDAAIAEVIRDTAQTFYHPVGTCQMGTHDMAVVDSELRVHGVEGLRVADASIMPTIVRGHTNGPAIMIGEKASDLLLGRAPAVHRHRDLAAV